MSPATEPSERRPPHEATLYCTDCTHTSLINGDWVIHVHADYLDYECPECGTTIDSRRDGSNLTTQSEGALRFGSAD